MNKLKISKYADISTGNITEADGKLIANPHCPYLLALHVDNCGSFMYVPDLGDQDMRETLAAAGFSIAFLDVFKLARRQGIQIVRFDADAPLQPGFPVFEW